ncbi:hypothetical protein GQ600_24558 [Phytophthora cactorum]|nr:hypothetical protein GQ600_24558 [Phytophthora cactorum]
MQDGTSPAISVKKLLHKGIALFADEDIMANSFVCEYTGEVISGRNIDVEQRYKGEHFGVT